MKLGLFTALYADIPLADMLEKVKAMGIETVELYTGKLSVPSHCDPEMLLGSGDRLREFKDTLERFGLPISQLNCSGNPISPVPGEAAKHRDAFLQTIRLAEKLGIDTIADFSGCPGGGPRDETPNWVTCPWPEDFLSILAYQWNDVLIPFWTWAVREAADYGVTKIGLEMHPGFCVYNPETLLRLRAEVGNAIGSNFDPSHLIWQGIDIPEAVLSLRDAIFHVHAKDTRVSARNIRKNGNLDTKHYSDAERRAWVFAAVGYGNGEHYWKSIMNALATIGYDGVISIEHEDGFMSKDEGLRKAIEMLNRMIIREKPGAMWWA